MKLKYRLIIIYATLILVLILSLVTASSVVFRNSFNKYIIQNREESANKIVNQVLELFIKDGTPNYDDLYNIGIEALDDGLILMVNTDYNNQLICISDIIPNQSNLMLSKMEETLQGIYPHISGEYQEDRYVLENDGTVYGYVTLGYYGPIYYTEFDALFFKAVKSAIYTIGFIFFVLSIVVVYFLASKLSKPLHVISDKAKDIGKGNYNELIYTKSNTEEIQNLIDSINTLAQNLENQQQIKKELAVNYTHELRTPITCMLTTLEGMLDGIFDITYERLESLYFGITRVSNMISDVDKLIETSNNEYDLSKTNFEFDEIIEKSILNFDCVFRNKNINLSFKKDIDETFTILADEEKIKSLVINLISNALKYTDTDGYVIITLSKKDKKYIFSVKDTGIGIDENEQKIIFEHLYRVETSRVKDVAGFGIGLSICKNVVLAHKGTITVKSKLGVGSEFIVQLPI